MITFLCLLFAIGVLEFGEDKAKFAQVACGLATMGLTVIGLVLNAIP